MGFNLFGSSTSKKQYTTNNTTENTKVDNSLSEVGDYGQIIKDVSGDVTLTDYGAVKNSYDLAEKAVDSATSSVNKSFDAIYDNNNLTRYLSTENNRYARDVNTDSLNFASSTLDQVLTASADQSKAVRDQADKEATRNFDLATQHSRSEGAEAFASTVKIAGWGIALFGSAFILKQLMAGEA